MSADDYFIKIFWGQTTHPASRTTAWGKPKPGAIREICEAASVLQVMHELHTPKKLTAEEYVQEVADAAAK